MKIHFFSEHNPEICTLSPENPAEVPDIFKKYLKIVEMQVNVLSTGFYAKSKFTFFQKILYLEIIITSDLILFFGFQIKFSEKNFFCGFRVNLFCYRN